MIYITGDCHGNFERFNASIFLEQNEIIYLWWSQQS